MTSSHKFSFLAYNVVHSVHTQHIKATCDVKVLCATSCKKKNTIQQVRQK